MTEDRKNKLKREAAIVSAYKAGCWGQARKLTPPITVEEARTYGIVAHKGEGPRKSRAWYWTEADRVRGYTTGWYITRQDALLFGVGQEIVERHRALCEPAQRKDHD